MTKLPLKFQPTSSVQNLFLGLTLLACFCCFSIFFRICRDLRFLSQCSEAPRQFSTELPGWKLDSLILNASSFHFKNFSFLVRWEGIAMHFPRQNRVHAAPTAHYRSTLNHPRGFFKNLFLNINFFISQKLRFFRKILTDFFEKIILFSEWFFYFFLADG